MSAFHSAQKYRPGIIKNGTAVDGSPMFSAFTLAGADEEIFDLKEEIDDAFGPSANIIREVRLFSETAGWHLFNRAGAHGFGIPVGTGGGDPPVGTDDLGAPPLVLHFGPSGVPANIKIQNDSGIADILSVLCLT